VPPFPRKTSGGGNAGRAVGDAATAGLNGFRAMDLSETQIRVIRLLAKSRKGLSRQDVADKAPVNASFNEHVGPIHKDESRDWDEKYGRRSLVSLGLVDVKMGDDDSGGMVPLFSLTPAGRHAHRVVVPAQRVVFTIPDDVIDPIVIAEMGLHAYGMENYTDADLDHIRSQLPVEYHNVPLRPDLYRLINGRRKKGVYSKRRKWVRPEWYDRYRQSAHFKALRSESLKAWNYRCALNSMHTTSPDVYHRNMGSGGCQLGRETLNDLIVLCPKCATSNRVRLPAIPDHSPSHIG
jgi:hypothetical protein